MQAKASCGLECDEAGSSVFSAWRTPELGAAALCQVLIPYMGTHSDLWEEGNAADSCLKVNSTSYLPWILNWEIMEGREESPEDAASASFCKLRQGMLLLPNLSSP